MFPCASPFFVGAVQIQGNPCVEANAAVRVSSASSHVPLELYGAWEQAPSIFETLQKHSLNSDNAGVKKKK